MQFVLQLIHLIGYEKITTKPYVSEYNLVECQLYRDPKPFPKLSEFKNLWNKFCNNGEVECRRLDTQITNLKFKCNDECICNCLISSLGGHFTINIACNPRI